MDREMSTIKTAAMVSLSALILAVITFAFWIFIDLMDLYFHLFASAGLAMTIAGAVVYYIRKWWEDHTLDHAATRELMRTKAYKELIAE
ncbi:hypothetical protein [Acinetobacter sp.]|uniref:hypothetical protein n=1 Tax=Acinetobacter sp. TaxID=472 RepID=UPI003D06E1AE